MAAVFFSAQDAKASNQEPLAVVELFTSQGCSSCPPADEFLGELSERQNILALSFHVDYWDYIGWKDEFAQRAFTNRQRAYARAFDLRYVYTPQMVMSGQYETSGNSRRNVLRAIERQLSDPDRVLIETTSDRITLKGPVVDYTKSIYHVAYKPEVKTEVRRGENRGRQLTNFNTVIALNEVGQYRGGTSEISLEKAALDPALAHAIFVQRNDNLEIIGAAKLR